MDQHALRFEQEAVHSCGNGGSGVGGDHAERQRVPAHADLPLHPAGPEREGAKHVPFANEHALARGREELEVLRGEDPGLRGHRIGLRARDVGLMGPQQLAAPDLERPKLAVLIDPQDDALRDRQGSLESRHKILDRPGGRELLAAEGSRPARRSRRSIDRHELVVSGEKDRVAHRV